MKMVRNSLAVAAMLVMGVPAATVHAQPKDLSIVTGNTGGTFYPVGVGLAKLLSDAGMQSAADVGGVY